MTRRRGMPYVLGVTQSRRRRAGRVPGSVRFDPYYKAQVWRDDVGGAWVDIQTAYPTLDDAIRAVPASVRGRVMRITIGGREPVWEGED